ncbi:MAG: sn-glycerol-3-phosphate ABC transporter ATP-binding protein UgpC [Gammaproteobacteria bacterium]
MAEVRLQGVRKSFGGTEVIKGIDLQIPDNRFTVFVGPSGCGKSTLLRLIAGLEDLSAGRILIDGEVVNDLPPARRGISMVFQSYALYPHMTVYDNMAFGLKLARHNRQSIRERVRRAAATLQIEPLLSRRPRELSGGQRQRVAIGRAIVRDPRVFLFDEPLSNLDAALRVQMRIELGKLQKDLQGTMVYVTHDQVEAMTLGHRIVVLNGGVVEQAGSPLELYHRPRNLFVAGFIGSPGMNLLHATLTAVDREGVTVRLGSGLQVAVPVAAERLQSGAAVTLGVRPEHLSEAGAGDVQVAGEVLVTERLGGETYLYVRLEDGQEITVKAAGDTATGTGDRVRVGVRGGDCHLFDNDGAALERTAPLPSG